MPNKPAAKKALRQSEKKMVRNLNVKNNIRFLLRKTKKHIKLNEPAETTQTVAQAIKAIDKAAQKGILKKNTAARKKSRIMKRLAMTGV